jgi:cyclic-di-GMP-binding protein
VQQYARDPAAAAGFGKLAQVAAARAIRALRRQLQWLRIRYAATPPAIWTALAQIYTAVEHDDVTAEMLIYPGETTTLQREFLKTLVQSALSCENLQPGGQDLATFLVSRHASHFVLSKKRRDGCTHWFDLKHPQPPAPVSQAPERGADVRYFGPGTAAASLTQALQAIEKSGNVPAELGFKYDIELPFLLPVLTQMQRDWSGAAHARAHEREKTNARITVVPGFDHTLKVLEQTLVDPFDFTHKSEVESWVVNDISAAGFGAILPAITSDWVSVGSVAGIASDVAGEWAVAMVRRARRLGNGNGQLEIGMQVLSRNATAVRMMREDATEVEQRITQRMPIDSAILLTPEAARQKAVEVLVTDATLYGPGNVYMLVGDLVLVVQFREILEENTACARIGFSVVGLSA